MWKGHLFLCACVKCSSASALTAYRARGRQQFLMASQPVSSTTICNYSFDSYIRGYHAYKDCRSQPWIGEVLPLERDPTNPQDKFAVAVKKCGETVGHLPFNVAPVVSAFLSRTASKALVEVTGDRVNRGAGYGLEIPCKYHFYGSGPYIERLKTIVEKLRSDGLL